MTKYDEMCRLIVEIKNRFGMDCARGVIFAHGHAKKLHQVPEKHWDEVIAEAKKLLLTVNATAIQVREPGKKNRVVRPQETPRKTEMPKAIAAPYGTSAESQFYEAVKGIIDTREKAQVMVAELQAKWDLIDENAQLRLLMEKMEERHGDEFNAFFEATLRQVMIGSGMTELRINTGAVLQTLVESRPMRVREVPGFLIYELVEDVPDADIH